MEFNKDKWCVYIHRNKINNKAYIGIAKGNPEHRWGQNGKKYKQDSQPVFYNAIQKYGWDNFEHIIWNTNLTHEDAKHIEKTLITLFKTNCRLYKNPEYGYNETNGGDGTSGRKQSEETRKKMSKNRKGKYTKENSYWYGKHISEETKEKLRFANKGRQLSEETKKKMSKSHTGMVFSEEHRKNMSIANQKETAGFHGHVHTEEAKKKQSDAIRKRNSTEEWKLNNKIKLSKPVVQLDMNNNFIKIWSYMVDASIELHIYKSGIIRCCRGINKTAGGYQWKYLYDQTAKDGTIIPGAITLGLITEEEALKQLSEQKAKIPS